MPFEITSRYLTAYFEVNTKTCHTYIDFAVADPTKANTICDSYDLSNLDDVKTFLAATYYGGSFLDTLKTDTGLTDPEIALLFGKDPKSFQTAYLSELKTIKDLHKCVAESDRCTDEELA